VGVDHGRFQAGMTELLLDDADVVARLQQVGGEGVAEAMGGHSFMDFRLVDSMIERLFQQ